MKNTYRNILFLLAVCLFGHACIEDSFEHASREIRIHFENNTVVIDNQLSAYGVFVSAENQHVVVKTGYEGEDLKIRVSGNTPNGSLKIYGKRRFELVLNNVQISNPAGPAINVQSGKRVTVTLPDGSVNQLSDGVNYPSDTLINGVMEEQSAAFFSEGSLFFSGTGQLQVHGNGLNQHAISSDDKIHIDHASIEIVSAQKDGLHCNDGFVQNSGTLNIQSTGDAVDAGSSYVDILGGSVTIQTNALSSDGIVCDSTLRIMAGMVLVEVTGDRSRGLRSSSLVQIGGGNVTITASGNAVLNQVKDGFDPSFSAAVKSDGMVVVDGGSLHITHSGKGGRGISSDLPLSILSGDVQILVSGAAANYTDSTGVTDTYAATGISSDSSVHILGGKLQVEATSNGSRCVSVDGSVYVGSANQHPEVEFKASGSVLWVDTEYELEPKLVKCDGSFYMRNGSAFFNASGAGEAIDARKSLFMEGGTLVAQGSANGKNVRTLDYRDQFLITGGTLLVCGAYRDPTTRNSVPLPTSGTTQNTIIVKSVTNAFFAADAFLGLGDADANFLFAFKPLRNAYYIMYSSDNLLLNSKNYFYKDGMYQGGDSINGLYRNGMYVNGEIRNSYTQTTAVSQFVAL